MGCSNATQHNVSAQTDTEAAEHDANQYKMGCSNAGMYTVSKKRFHSFASGLMMATQTSDSSLMAIPNIVTSTFVRKQHCRAGIRTVPAAFRTSPRRPRP